ncbi:MAG: type II secretion system protein [Acetatifactor sp.]
MKKELNNKGFSLVELIIVIAIMAVLMGVLAPQYLKYVKSSKVSTDITNAEEIATAINVAVADGSSSNADTISITSGVAFSGGDTIITKNAGGTVDAPTPKVDSSYTWEVDFDDVNGVKEIRLGGSKIWPTSSAYESANS